MNLKNISQYQNIFREVGAGNIQDALIAMVDTIPENIDIPEIDTEQFATAAQGIKAQVKFIMESYICHKIMVQPLKSLI